VLMELAERELASGSPAGGGAGPSPGDLPSPGGRPATGEASLAGRRGTEMGNEYFSGMS